MTSVDSNDILYNSMYAWCPNARLFVTKETPPPVTPGRTTSAVCFSLPISFLWENDKVKINPFNHVVKNDSWWFGPCSHFFFLRNHDGSNYPFTDDVKHHVCLVSPAQSKKNPKVSAKTVVVPEQARPINRRDKILFCPGRHWDKKFLSPSNGTKQFCPRNRFLSPVP